MEITNLMIQMQQIRKKKFQVNKIQCFISGGEYWKLEFKVEMKLKLVALKQTGTKK